MAGSICILSSCLHSVDCLLRGYAIVGLCEFHACWVVLAVLDDNFGLATPLENG